jgi:hypothetical protein
MNDPVKLCVQCQFFYQKPNPLMNRFGFQNRSLCASPEAMRNSALALVHGEPVDECQAMRASRYACGLEARWFELKDKPETVVVVDETIGSLTPQEV